MLLEVGLVDAANFPIKWLYKELDDIVPRPDLDKLNCNRKPKKIKLTMHTYPKKRYKRLFF